MGRGISLHFFIEDTSPTFVRGDRSRYDKKCTDKVVIYELVLKAALTNNNPAYVVSAFPCSVNEAHLSNRPQHRRMTP
jgi:hypothetical protein